MTSDEPAAQRLLVQGVVASTMQLVRGMRDEWEVHAVRRLMRERRRMLAELSIVDTSLAQPGPVWALHAAVVESDRTLEALLK